jgi:hypothetical protein
METEGAQERLKVALRGLMSLSPGHRGPIVFALLLAALIALLAAACGGDAGTGVDAGTDNGAANRSGLEQITIETYQSPT